MITIDCPLCLGDATVDEALTVVACDGCGTTDVAEDAHLTLDAAA
jgi:hypothetical protein